MSNITVSFATTVWNEHLELESLMQSLLPILSSDDEIVVQGDQGKVTDKVVSVMHKYIKHPQVKYIEYPLKRNFASFKNNLFKNCSKDYIFNIDADELMVDSLALNFREVLSENADVDMFRLPRINIVDGITSEIISAWNWRMNEDGWVNFPDYQCRILRNNIGIKWVNSVHEILTGYSVTSDFPPSPEWSLVHIKSIDRQVKQNEFYSTF